MHNTHSSKIAWTGAKYLRVSLIDVFILIGTLLSSPYSSLALYLFLARPYEIFLPNENIETFPSSANKFPCTRMYCNVFYSVRVLWLGLSVPLIGSVCRTNINGIEKKIVFETKLRIKWRQIEKEKTRETRGKGVRERVKNSFWGLHQCLVGPKKLKGFWIKTLHIHIHTHMYTTSNLVL